MLFEIGLTQRARRQMKKLDRPMLSRILKFVRERVALKEDPRMVGQALTGQLAGCWRYRVGDIRILCEISFPQHLITILAVSRRDSVYGVAYQALPDQIPDAMEDDLPAVLESIKRLRAGEEDTVPLDECPELS